MRHTFIFPSVILLASSTGAFAQGFTGGSVDLTYQSYQDFEELTGTLLEASLEFALSSQFSLAIDSTQKTIDGFDFTFPSTTLHAIYGINPDVAAGGWVSQANFPGTSVDTYGAEVAYAVGSVDLQGYLGGGDFTGDDLIMYGVSASYGFGNGFSARGAYDGITLDGPSIDVAVIEVGSEYGFASGAAIFANLGTVMIDDGGTQDETYFEIGASFGFGPNGGTTFDGRGLFDVFPLF